MGNNVLKTDYEYKFHTENTFSIQEGGVKVEIPPDFIKKIYSSFSKGDDWKALSAEQLMQIAYDDDWVMVSVMGLFDKGKTWLINKLNNMNLQSGTDVHTQGLSFKVGKNCIFMDTAGCHSPVNPKVFGNEKSMDKSGSLSTTSEDKSGPLGPTSTDKTGSLRTTIALKKYAEQFQRELILRLADIVIIVVSELTWPDQEYIESAFEKLTAYSRTESTDILIVHNFKSARTKEELTRRITEYVKANFELIPPKDNALYLEENRKCIGSNGLEQKVSIRHFCLMNDNYGREWNRQVIDKVFQICSAKRSSSFGGNQIAMRVMQATKECLKPLKPEEIQEITIKGKIETDEFGQDRLELKLCCSSQFYDLKNIRTTNDSFNYNLKTQCFKPKVDTIVKDGKFTINLEIPGQIENFNARIVNKRIFIAGNKKMSFPKDGKWVEYGNAGKLIQQEITHGSFALEIELPNGYEKVSGLSQSAISSKNGFITIEVEEPLSAEGLCINFD